MIKASNWTKLFTGLTVSASLLLASASAQDAGWPRSFHNADGTVTEIAAQPQRILSTSVSVTGSLLAFDAPVIASGSAGNGTFFAQWAAIADERGVTNAWAAGNVDLEAAWAVEPDLIVISTTGADSALAQRAELEQVAPVIVVDYGSQTWQELATELGQATGLESAVSSMLFDVELQIAAAEAKLSLPAGTINVISYNGAGADNQIARVGGPHAELLAGLGFTIEDPNVEWRNQASVRGDFVWAAFERLTELTSETTFLLRLTDEQVGDFVAEPVLANLPSVQAGQVYGLGANSFRIDYYSSLEIIEDLTVKFGN